MLHNSTMLCVFEVKAFGFYLTIIEPSHETLNFVTAATFEDENSYSLIRNSYISKSAV